MGMAKQRGTFDERKEQAIRGGRAKEHEVVKKWRSRKDRQKIEVRSAEELQEAIRLLGSHLGYRNV